MMQPSENYSTNVGIYSQKVEELPRVGGQLGIVPCLFVSKLSIYWPGRLTSTSCRRSCLGTSLPLSLSLFPQITLSPRTVWRMGQSSVERPLCVCQCVYVCVCVFLFNGCEPKSKWRAVTCGDPWEMQPGLQQAVGTSHSESQLHDYQSKLLALDDWCNICRTFIG